MLETKLKTAGIDHTVLHVKDLVRSKQFYMEVLGMTVKHKTPPMRFSGAATGRWYLSSKLRKKR